MPCCKPSTALAAIVKPEPDDALGVPLPEIEATQPSDFDHRPSEVLHTLKKISDTIAVRNRAQLPFLEQVIRYDGGHEKWKYIYWTCEKVDGWSGSDCWDHGS